MVEDDLLDGNGIYGAINAYGRVGYTHAGGIDRPLGAVRGTAPFYPHTNARGLYEAATVDNGRVLGNDVAWGRCRDSLIMKNGLRRDSLCESRYLRHLAAFSASWH